MTTKRFATNGKEIIQNKQVWCMANSEYCADVIATAMNELYEENKELEEENEYLCEKIKENEWHWNTIDEDRDVWRYKCKTLEEENEQLKKENQELKRLIKVTVEDYTDLKQSFDLIDNENEQLRELLENGLEVSQVEIDEELERMNNRS